MAKEDLNGSPISDGAPYRIIPRQAPPEQVSRAMSDLGRQLTPIVCRAWVAVADGMVRGYATEADAEQAAIEEARRNPGKTVSVLKAVRAYRTDEPTVKSVPVEG